MATRRSSFEKRERDKNKKARAAAKREKRLDKGGEAPDETDEAKPSTPPTDQQAVFDALAALHAAYDDGRVNFDDFEEQRAELLGRLEV
jgi:ubiquitin